MSLSLYLGGAIPGISGLMHDSDWQNYEDPTMKTNYSISKNTIDNGFDCDIKLSGTITPKTWLKLKPFISYSFNKVYFISSDAEGWYGDSSSMKLHSGQKINVSWDDESALHLKKGELCSIDYYRNTHNLFIGGEADFSFFENFTVLTSISIAPINYISSVDTHWSNTNKTSGTMYNDRILGYFNYYSGKIGLEYKPLIFMTVGLCGKYSYLHLMKGVTYTKGTATKKYPTKPSTSSYSGASGRLIDASF